jgi:hypothetical protein
MYVLTNIDKQEKLWKRRSNKRRKMNRQNTRSLQHHR